MRETRVAMNSTGPAVSWTRICAPFDSRIPPFGPGELVAEDDREVWQEDGLVDLVP
jgi:hypothetical protein